MMARRLILQSLAVRHGPYGVKTCTRNSNVCLMPPALKDLVHRTICISTPCFENALPEKSDEVKKPRFFVNNDNVTATEMIGNFTNQECLKLEEIKMQYELLQSRGRMVPQEMTDDLWLHMMNCESRKSIENTFRALSLRETARNRDKVLSQIKGEEKLELLKDNILQSTSFDNRIYSRFVNSPVTLMKDLHLSNMMLLSPPMVFDLSFGDYHTFRELKELAKQLMFIYGFNRELIEPYHMHFCGVDDTTIPVIEKCFMRPLEHLAITITRKSFVDLFPQQRLVYLSPDSPNVYRYHPDDIPVIGGIVDLSRNDRLSLRTAKKFGVRHAQLPVDQYLSWIEGKKMFPLNHVFEIMHIVAETRDWEFAFNRVIPRRCFKTRWI